MLKRFLGCLLTVALLVLAHHTMVLLHEWTHGASAWCFGLKSSPFAIHYGDWSLLDVDEAVDYHALFSSGRGHVASVIAGSALVTNGILFLLTALLLTKGALGKNRWLHTFLYWFLVMNIAELYSYLVLRALPPSGDVLNFNRGLGSPAWPIFVAGIPLVALGLWYTLGRDLPRFAGGLWPGQLTAQRVIVALTVFVVFFFFGSAPYFYNGRHDPRSLWSLASMLLGIVIGTWSILSLAGPRGEPTARP